MEITNQELSKFYTTDFAYWIGVVQSDGYFKKQFVKKTGKILYYIALHIGKKSLPMQKKFKIISRKLFNRKGGSYVYTSPEKQIRYMYQFSCKEFLNLFEYFSIRLVDPPTPPKFIRKDNRLFGAYLAGMIDGDGDVRVCRPKYPQCKVRISGRCCPHALISTIKDIMGCKVNHRKRVALKNIRGREFIGTTYIIEFYVSKKNITFINEKVMPHLALAYKKAILQKYINIKNGAACGL